MHLVNGTGNSPSPGQPTPGVVKQDKSSGGSVDTTKTRSDPQRVRMSSGEGPMGAAKGKQPDAEALCPTPPPPGSLRNSLAGVLHPPPQCKENADGTREAVGRTAQDACRTCRDHRGGRETRVQGDASVLPLRLRLPVWTVET